MTSYAIYPMGTASFGAATPPSNIAEYLKTPTGTVYIASNTPVVGQVLIATSATNATWQTPSAYTTINDLRINGNATNTATAAGPLSVALGRNTYAGGTNSITLGPNTTTDTSTSVVVGNSCSTVARSGANNGDSCVIVGSNSIISNAGGAGSGASYDYNISIGALNTANYQSGNGHVCSNNTLVGASNTWTIAHQSVFRRNFFITQGHNITTNGAHSANIQDNIIMGREGSYTSDGTLASSNVVIGTVPRWSGCNSSVIIGPTNNAAVKTSVVIGTANTVPAAAGTNLVLIGNNANITGTSTNCILIGEGVGALSAADSICIGYGAGASATNCIVMGKGSTSSGAESIGIGNAAINTGTQSIAIGTGANVAGNNTVAIGRIAQGAGSGGTAVGYWAQASGTDAVSIGRFAFCSFGATRGTALGTQAAVLNGTTDSVQLGNGSNGSSGTLQFRQWQIHNGVLAGEDTVVMKPAGSGSYTAVGQGHNISIKPNGPIYYGLIAGRSADPNKLQFADYDVANGHDLPSYELDVTDCPVSASFVYRDGLNIVQSSPALEPRVNGYDQRWGCNTFWRFGSVRTTGNRDTIIPLVQIPWSHYIHMELTITGMRMATFNEATHVWNGGQISGSTFIVDPGLKGGRSWSGIAAARIGGAGECVACRVTNNWGGNASDADESPFIDSVSGTLGSLAVGLAGAAPYVGAPLSAVTQIAVDSIALGDMADEALASKVGRGFSRFATGLMSFGDYEVQRIAFIRPAGVYRKVIIGVAVKGKTGHHVDWRVSARCTVVPWSDPNSGPGPT